MIEPEEGMIDARTKFPGLLQRSVAQFSVAQGMHGMVQQGWPGQLQGLDRGQSIDYLGVGELSDVSGYDVTQRPAEGSSMVIVQYVEGAA